MDSSNTIKEFFENRGGIKMELNTISGLAIAGVICSVVLSMGGTDCFAHCRKGEA